MKNASLREAPPHEPPPRRLSVTSIPPSALCPPRSTWFFTLLFVGHFDCFSCLFLLFPEHLVGPWPMFKDRQQQFSEIWFKWWQIASLALWRYTLSISHWDVSLLCVVSSAASSQVVKKQWQAAGGSRHASQALIHIIVTIFNIVIFNICPSSCYSDRTPLHHHHHRHQKHQQQHHQDHQEKYSQQHCSDTVHVFMDLHLGRASNRIALWRRFKCQQWGPSPLFIYLTSIFPLLALAQALSCFKLLTWRFAPTTYSSCWSTRFSRTLSNCLQNNPNHAYSCLGFRKLFIPCITSNAISQWVI